VIGRVLKVRTEDGWTTEHPDVDKVLLEGDELVFQRETEVLGRQEPRQVFAKHNSIAATTGPLSE